MFQNPLQKQPESESNSPTTRSYLSTLKRPARKELTSAIRMKSLYVLYATRKREKFYPSQEFPVCLLRWSDRNGDKASQLEVIEEFRSFVKPSWRPHLSEFCTELTGITQVCTLFISLDAVNADEPDRTKLVS